MRSTTNAAQASEPESIGNHPSKPAIVSMPRTEADGLRITKLRPAATWERRAVTSAWSPAESMNVVARDVDNYVSTTVANASLS